MSEADRMKGIEARLESDCSTYNESAAISLKRIADALDRLYAIAEADLFHKKTGL